MFGFDAGVFRYCPPGTRARWELSALRIPGGSTALFKFIVSARMGRPGPALFAQVLYESTAPGAAVT